MSEWAKIVTQPLGLVGFGLFLVFAHLAKVKRHDERRWLSRVALTFAAVALLGGLTLAYLQTPRPIAPAVQTSIPLVPSHQQTNQVQQSSSGDGSSNVQGVQGDVKITVDQSTGKTHMEAKKPAEKQSKQSNH
jgi:hypothetical protein